MRGIPVPTREIQKPAQEFKGIIRHPIVVCGLFVTGLATIAMMPVLSHGLPPIEDAFAHYRWASGYIEALSEGTIYPRWLPNPNYGAGSPAMNYYPPLPFYVVAAFTLLTGSTLKAMALGCWLSLALSGATMYVFARSLISHKWSLLAAALYVLAPYHLMDLYQRASLSEFWAFTWIPLVLYSARRVATGGGWRSVSLLAISYALLLFTHVLSAFAITLILPVYILFMTRDLRQIAMAAAGLVMGAGLSAIFLVPLILERDYVRLHRINLSKYLRFFLVENLPAALKAGPLPAGQEAEFFYQYPDYYLFEASVLLAIALLALAALFVWGRRGGDSPRDTKVVVMRAVWVVTLVCLFMTTRLSAPIWSVVPGLPYMQFPFRWLVIASAGISLLTAATWSAAIQKKSRVVYAVALALLVGLNIVVSVFAITRQQRGEQAIPEEAAGLDMPEYRPRGWEFRSAKAASATASSVISGEASVQPLDERGAKQSYSVIAETESLIRFRTLYFPGWVARIEEDQIALARSEDGYIQLQVAPGEHRLTLSFEETPPRTAGKIISAISFLIMVAMFFARRFSQRASVTSAV
jgi:hypothetical protein